MIFFIRRYIPVTLFMALLWGAYLWWPSPGQVVVQWQAENRQPAGWPQLTITTTDLGWQIHITDQIPYGFVALYLDGQPAELLSYEENNGWWTWHWYTNQPITGQTHLVLYRDCHVGCLVWAEWHPPQPAADHQPTKLGVVFPDLQRNWHNQQGWVVEVTYADLAETDYWGVADLAERVYQHQKQGLRVLVRVDFAKGQSLPPAGDYVALDQYLTFVRRLAQDARLRSIHALIIGSSFNTAGNNQLTPEQKPTPAAWVARVLAGYGEEVTRTDNVLAQVKLVNPHLKVLVGPVSAWSWEQDEAQIFNNVDVPWLNYFNTLVSALNEVALAHPAYLRPDGFAVQAFGQTTAPELGQTPPAEEPLTDLKRPDWGGAQAGFRIYQDWQAIINHYPATALLPIYITAANTFDYSTGQPPAQTYPAGWLTAAVQEVNSQPQILALCWFMDSFPDDPQWKYFALTPPVGQVNLTAEEFSILLKQGNVAP